MDLGPRQCPRHDCRGCSVVGAVQAAERRQTVAGAGSGWCRKRGDRGLRCHKLNIAVQQAARPGGHPALAMCHCRAGTLHWQWNVINMRPLSLFVFIHLVFVSLSDLRVNHRIVHRPLTCHGPDCFLSQQKLIPFHECFVFSIPPRPDTDCA